MPIMSKNQKYLVMLALLAGAAPAAVVAQDQAQDAPPADVSASVAMPAAELTEGPEIKGIISARSGDRMQVTAADGSKSVITINDDDICSRRISIVVVIIIDDAFCRGGRLLLLVIINLL